MKQLLVLSMILLVLIPSVYAEDDKWIDGIKIRAGFNASVTRFRMPWEGDREIIETRGSSQIRSPIFPISISLPETLMNSWSFRGGVFEYQAPTKMKDLYPYVDQEPSVNTTILRQKSSSRTSLYNNFFNDSDKAFADANTNWALSADVTSSRLALGYHWGVFFPAFENQRFLKFGAGLGVFFTNISYKLNLCSQYKVSFTKKEPSDYGGECVGKKEIDSTSANFFGYSWNWTITLWERVTKDSIWKIISGVAANTAGNNADKLKLKNHDRNLNVWMSAEHIEYISYTYRF